MEDSQNFSYVPFVGKNNISRFKDNETGLERVGLMAFNEDAGPDPIWITKENTGDDGNIITAGGTVESYTTKEPAGRELGGDGNMLTSIQLVADAEEPAGEGGPFISFNAIPAGLEGLLLDSKFNLGNQPPEGSFDYSQWLPRYAAKGVVGFYGGLVPPSYQSSPNNPLPWDATGRFPSIPGVEPGSVDFCGPLLYLPSGFYGDISQILNDLWSPDDPIDISLIDAPQYGVLVSILQAETSAIDWSIDFSWSGSN